MTRFLIVLALIWAALMPPFFTGGTCTQEYEAASALVTAPEYQAALRSSESALKFLQSRGVQAQALTPEACSQHKPRWLTQCGRGTTVWAEVPVRNAVCSLYRDDKTRLQLRYDKRGSLVGVLTEMNPFKFLPLPWGGALNWAK